MLLLPAALAQTYTLDGVKSDLYVLVYKDPSTVAANMSHDHIVQATAWRGTVTWDAANPAACKIDITVPVGNLRNDDPAWRTKVGFDTPVTDSQRDEIRENMTAEGQLWGKKFPDLKYVGTRCEPVGDRYNVTGTLTMRGVGKTLTVPMKIAATATEFAAKGSFKASATDFGFDPYSALMGALKNKNEMAFTVDVVGRVK